MESKSLNYHEKLKAQNVLKLRELLKKLPSFAAEYFIGKNDVISSRTKIAYAYDLIVFFEYIYDSDPKFQKSLIKDYKIDILDEITRNDILFYMEYLSYYEKDGKVYTNDERGKARKLASLKSFYHYYFVNELKVDHGKTPWLSPSTARLSR